MLSCADSPCPASVPMASPPSSLRGRYLDFDISGFPTRPGLERPYCAGDVALLYPENPDDAVTDFVTVTGLDPQATAHISRPQVGRQAGWQWGAAGGGGRRLGFGDSD